LREVAKQTIHVVVVNYINLATSRHFIFGRINESSVCSSDSKDCFYISGQIESKASY
jgi:hypothetical protein